MKGTVLGHIESCCKHSNVPTGRKKVVTCQILGKAYTDSSPKRAEAEISIRPKAKSLKGWGWGEEVGWLWEVGGKEVAGLGANRGNRFAHA